MIRPFQRGDITAILHVEAQAFPKTPYPAELFQRYHRMYPDTFLVYTETEVLGYVLFEPDGHVISIAVDAARRRRGIGTELMSACARLCAPGRLYIEVRVGNTGAQEFYRRLGFDMKARSRGYYGKEDAYVMEKQNP